MMAWCFIGVLSAISEASLGESEISRATGWTPIFVDTSADGLNDGTSWQDAFVDLQDALVAADSGDEIWVAAGYHVDSDGQVVPVDQIDRTQAHNKLWAGTGRDDLPREFVQP